MVEKEKEDTKGNRVVLQKEEVEIRRQGSPTLSWRKLWDRLLAEDKK